MKRVVTSMIAMLAMIMALSVNAAYALPDDGHGGGGGHHGEGGDDNEVKFTGAIESLPASGFIGDWTIAGRTVHVTSSTEIESEHTTIAVGVQVKVEGQARADASVDAQQIEVAQEAENPENEVEFKGTIESLPSAAGFIGDWSIGGKTVHVTADTRIDTEHGPVVVGAFVEVHATMRADGSLDATKIQVENNPAGDDGRAEVKGAIESLPSGGLIGDWTVAGKTIHVSASTSINQEHGAAVVGASVEIEGTLNPDGSIDATRIEVKSSSSTGTGSGSGSGSEGQSTSFKGTVQATPAGGVIGDWTISGKTVHVVSSTKLKAQHGALAVGARVKVKGMTMADGTVVATRIQARD